MGCGLWKGSLGRGGNGSARLSCEVMLKAASPNWQKWLSQKLNLAQREEAVAWSPRIVLPPLHTTSNGSRARDTASAQGD